MTPVTFLEPYILLLKTVSKWSNSIAKIRHSEENGLFNFGPKYGPDLDAVSKNS